MSFDAALWNEQGQNLAVVAVKPEVFNTTASLQQALRACHHRFPDADKLVITANVRGQHRLYGSEDLVRYLSNGDLRRLPWRQYYDAA